MYVKWIDKIYVKIRGYGRDDMYDKTYCDTCKYYYDVMYNVIKS